MSDEAQTLLVVDDNPATLYSTSRILRSVGYTVHEATLGQQALDIARTAHPHLVLLDVHLPDLHGFEVCRLLRADPRTAHLPVVHVSATFVGSMDQAQGLEAGADAYLTHPLDPLVLIGSVRALLRTQRAEAQMRVSEAKFRAVFEQAHGGIALFDEALCYLQANPFLAELLGVGGEALRGQPLVARVPPAFMPQFEALSTALATGAAWRGVLPLNRADGSEVPLEWSMSTHSLPGVRMAIVTDISQRLTAEREREALLASERAARAEAERASRIKDQFLATLSHELRNPLSVMLSWAAVLQRRHEEPQLQEGLRIIERNARLQAQLIEDLLDVARITTGKLRLERESVAVAQVVEAAMQVVQPMAEKAGVSLHWETRDDAATVSADPARLQQMVWNLLTNAVKFSADGQAVRVSVVAHPERVEVVVRDDGRGISADFLPYVFEQFRQHDGSTRKSASGLGLGLAIVRSLAELHDGEVSAHSDGEGKGAEFRIRLPQAAAVVGHDAPLAGTVPAGRRLDGCSVLIVEDDADARAAMALQLAEAGATTHAAANVDEALARIAQACPSVVVSDIGMAVQDGYDLIRAIRARGFDAKRLPAVALTAFARSEDEQSVLHAGFQRHVAKPYEPGRLIAAIADLTGR